MSGTEGIWIIVSFALVLLITFFAVRQMLQGSRSGQIIIAGVVSSVVFEKLSDVFLKIHGILWGAQ